MFSVFTEFSPFSVLSVFSIFSVLFVFSVLFSLFFSEFVSSSTFSISFLTYPTNVPSFSETYFILYHSPSSFTTSTSCPFAITAIASESVDALLLILVSSLTVAPDVAYTFVPNKNVAINTAISTIAILNFLFINFV